MQNAIHLFSPLAIVSACVGVLGFSAMTWLFPFLGRLWVSFGAKVSVESAKVPLKKIAILIPAHNEERTLVKTLPSMQASIAYLHRAHPEVQVEIRIGADGCKDRTVEIVKSFGIEVVEAPVSKGKWRTVHDLIRSSVDADWVVLSDSGILWPENFLAACVPFYVQADVVGVAPTYRNPTAGLVEKLIWNLECSLKTMENSAGGTISVHGPTVMYRRTELLSAFDALSASGTTWINDDVAISLYLRLNHSDQRIVYVPTIASWDCAESHLETSGAPIREFNRRKRMVLGNLQWIKMILLPNWQQNSLAAFISLRRIFRVMWAYWMAAFVLTAAFVFGFNYFLILALAGSALAVICLGTRPIRMLLDSGFVSLLSPYYLMSGTGLSRWK